MVKFVPLAREDKQIAFLLFAITAALYARMAAPDVLAGDAGEFQFAAWTLGLAHPTGYPLYLLLGGVWQHVLAPVGVSPARALNLLSALFGAGSVALLFLLVRRWLTGPLLLARTSALLAAVMLAVNPTFWSQSLIAEVYALHAVFVVLIMLTAQNIELLRAGDRFVPTSRYAQLFFVVGLALTHHGMTLLLLPGLLLYLNMVYRGWWRSFRHLLVLVAAAAAPLLIYLYIPLRSGPGPSPWYHQRLGSGVLTLYDGSRQAFWSYVTGQSISVGFYGWSDALGRVGQAGVLWKLHYYWPGLVLIVAGLTILYWQKRRAVLVLTLTYVVLQQLFNLFYAIDDILVYYIPMYVMASIWIGFAAELLATGVDAGLTAADLPKPAEPTGAEPQDAVQPVQESAKAVTAPVVLETPPATPESGQVAPVEGTSPPDAERTERERLQSSIFSLIVVFVLILLPWRLFKAYGETLDQSDEHSARVQWNEILAAEPPDDAVLVSNDRNEIVPLFYLQAVEGLAPEMTGLFPLIEPGARFADIGATLDTALDEGVPQPVILIKEMPGLEVKYTVQPAGVPLVEVVGPTSNGLPAVQTFASYGPLTLVGYDWTPIVDGVEVRLHWQVNDNVPGNYTTTVQIFDDSGDKIAQSDVRAGGAYYPTVLWKPGETLVEMHQLGFQSDGVGNPVPGEILISMYTGADFTPLADALRLPLDDVQIRR